MKTFFLAVITTFGVMGAINDAQSATTVSVDPKATFLETSGETDPSSIPVSLSGLGLTSGDAILLAEQGSFNFCCGQSTAMIALFSSSSSILDGSNLNRVPGAIGFPGSGVSTVTYFGNINNSITQDFFVNPAGSGGTTVTIPTGANYLFVAADDSLYSDNSLSGSPGFGVSISNVNPVPVPAAAWLFGSGLMGLAGMVRRHRQAA
ncbi:MAG: VPLPA-CTERM sorting domain-containing protein [Sulfuricaulis sp.]